MSGRPAHPIRGGSRIAAIAREPLPPTPTEFLRARPHFAQHSMASAVASSKQPLQISDRSFDAETTALMGQAFDKTCRELDKGQPASVKEIIAQRIIEIAGRGNAIPTE